MNFFFVVGKGQTNCTDCGIILVNRTLFDSQGPRPQLAARGGGLIIVLGTNQWVLFSSGLNVSRPLWSCSSVLLNMSIKFAPFSSSSSSNIMVKVVRFDFFFFFFDRLSSLVWLVPIFTWCRTPMAEQVTFFWFLLLLVVLEPVAEIKQFVFVADRWLTVACGIGVQ